MHTALVVTFSGIDRPGVVESLADVVTAQGGNWERSRMTRLAGRFAGVVEITIASDRAEGLERALEGVHGLRVNVDRPAPHVQPAREGTSLVLELTGHDRPGIVREVSRALARHDVNIEEMETESVSAPMSGGALFQARARLYAPRNVGLDVVRKVLEAVSQELMVDVRVSEGTHTGSR